MYNFVCDFDELYRPKPSICKTVHCSYLYSRWQTIEWFTATFQLIVVGFLFCFVISGQRCTSWTNYKCTDGWDFHSTKWWVHSTIAIVLFHHGRKVCDLWQNEHILCGGKCLWQNNDPNLVHCSSVHSYMHWSVLTNEKNDFQFHSLGLSFNDSAFGFSCLFSLQ